MKPLQTRLNLHFEMETHVLGSLQHYCGVYYTTHSTASVAAIECSVQPQQFPLLRWSLSSRD